MKLLFGHDEYVAKWVGRRIPGMENDGFGECAAIGVMFGERLVCGVVYNEFRPVYLSSSIHFAADDPKWATPNTIRMLLHYPFEQMGCMRVGAMINHRNARSLRFVQGIGFVKEGVARRAFGKNHGVILSMLRPEYQRRFLNRRQHGKENTIGSSASRSRSDGASAGRG